MSSGMLITSEEIPGLNRAIYQAIVDSRPPEIKNDIHTSPQSISVSLHLPNNPLQILGGLTGKTIGSYLQISLLWVSSKLRSQGAGGRLIAVAEAEARRRGCAHCLVDTFSKSLAPTATADNPEKAKGAIITLSASEPVDPALLSAISAGLNEHSASHEPPFLYNRLPLYIAPIEVSHRDLTGSNDRNLSNGNTDAHQYGLIGHSGGTLLVIERVWVAENSQCLIEEGLSSAVHQESVKMLSRLLQGAEQEAISRKCTGITALVYDFDPRTREAHDREGYTSLVTLEGWFTGRATGTLMYKILPS